MTALIGGNATQVARLTAISDRVVEACMTAAGFKYLAEPVPTGGTEFIPLVSREPEFMASFGYGQSTLLESNDLAFALREERSRLSPRRQYEDSLDADERSQYFKALMGTDDPDGGSADGGCVAQGDRAIHAELGLREGAASDPELATSLADVQSRTVSDPQYQAALAAWSSCMADRGYDFPSPDAPAVLMGDVASKVTVRGLKSVQALLDGAVVAVDVNDYDRTELDAAIQQEMALSTLDLACDAESGLGNVTSALRYREFATVYEKFFE